MMYVPSHRDAFEVLLLQAGDDERAAKLFGESYPRARMAALPFMVGDSYPDTYLEFPLLGNPFLDVTVLYGSLAESLRIDSPAVGDAEALLDWFVTVSNDYKDVSFGFELDAKEAELPQAAVHFQPRRHTELVAPFFEAAGEPKRARLYLDFAAKMPVAWQPAFFGMFRGRPDSPLRVCGYLNRVEKGVCSRNPKHLARVFDRAGFTAYDDALLMQASELMKCAPGGVDFQFDIYPDGSLGPTFAFDVQFEIQRPQLVREAFAQGPVAGVMNMLESWGAADERWHLAADATFARGIPVTLEDGSSGRYAFTLMPQWTKVRWTNGVLQPSKLYLLACAELLENR